MTLVDGNVLGHAADTRILLVEDDHGDAVLVQGSLFEVGVPDAAITWTRSLAEALDAVSLRPDCILLDLGLPDADGYSAVHKMVEAAPDVAVIVLTGRQERDGIDALAAGAQDYLVKDAITGELLERSIRYAMERKRAQLTQQQLREVRLSAAEQARLERGLLPTPLMRTGAVDVAAYYRPGRDGAVLGGDFYDVLETTDGVVRAVIGDVMGHGADEAALGVHLRVAWRSLLLAGLPDDDILPVLARLLASEDDGHTRFVTVCDVTISATSMTLRVAGHPAPIIRSSGGSRYPDVAVGVPLGVRSPAGCVPWPNTVVEIEPGSSIVLYTDGLLDAFADDMSSEGLGISEIVAAVDACVAGGGSAADWIPALLSSAPRESIDDTAVIVLTTAPLR
ncbi:MAG: SpoIIE family protein phosphatase [Jatrophihabitans sp.]